MAIKTIEVTGKVRGATEHVFLSEPVYYLSEMNLPGAPGQGNHRYQILGVIRDDKMADCHIDMGPERNFPGVDQIRIITAVITSNDRVEALYTAEEAMELADTLRGIRVDKSEWPVLDLMAGYQNYEEKRRKRIHAS